MALTLFAHTSRAREGRADIDDTSFPKPGRHSVGVARQYCGQLGKQDNCQVACRCRSPIIRRACRSPISCICRKEWAKDHARRRKAGVPKQISFKTKPQIALEQVCWAYQAGLPH
ncbi:MAG: transposase [Methylocella sp.]